MTVNSIHLYLALIMLFGFLLGFLFKRRGVSSSIGYLLAGITIGYVPGVEPDVEVFFKNIELLAITMLFLEIGFEVHVDRVKELFSFPLYISLFEMFLALSMIYGISIFLGLNMVESLILGLIASFSSTMFTFKLMEDIPPSSIDVKKTVLMVAAVEDFIIVFTLTLLEAGETVYKTYIQFLAYPLLIYSIAYLLSHRVLEKLLPRDENGLILLIGVGLGFSYLTGLLGLSPALGAFLTGLALSGISGIDVIMEKFRSIRVFILFLFFIGMGVGLAPTPVSYPELLVGIVLGLAMVFIHGFATITASTLFSGLGFIRGLETGFYLSTLSELSLVIIYVAIRMGKASPWLYIVVVIAMVSATLFSNYLVLNKSRIITWFFEKIPRDTLAGIERVIDLTRYTTSSPLYRASMKIIHTVLLGIGEALLLTTIAIIVAETLSRYMGFHVLTLLLIALPYLLLYLRITSKTINTIKHVFEEIYGRDIVLESIVEKLTILLMIEATLLLTFLVIAIEHIEKLTIVLGRDTAIALIALILIVSPIASILALEHMITKKK